MYAVQSCVVRKKLAENVTPRAIASVLQMLLQSRNKGLAARPWDTVLKGSIDPRTGLKEPFITMVTRLQGKPLSP